MKFEAIIKAIATSYLTMLEDWYFELLKDMNKYISLIGKQLVELQTIFN